MDVPHFDWADYVVLVTMLIVFIGIGVYFGFIAKSEKTVEEYILGSKNMKPWPVAFSLIASYVSGVTLLGIPTEVYTEDATMILLIVATVLSCLIGYHAFLPIYFEFGIFGLNEYAGLRFNKSVQYLSSALQNITYLSLIPSLTYVPAIVMSQATGINMYVISVVSIAIGVFYTMIGGIKAVIWTDFIQGILMLGSLLAIVAIGTYKVGGFGVVFSLAYQDGKLDIFNFDLSPFQRSSFLIASLGHVPSQLLLANTQIATQRFVSLKSRKDMRTVMTVFLVGYSVIMAVCVYGGLLLYASFYGCDPIKLKLVPKSDQLYAYYVLEKIHNIIGLPGLFLTGLFSAGLSTLSSVLNSVSGCIYEDFIKKEGMSDQQGRRIMKFIVVIIGVVSIGGVFLVAKMGKILSVAFAISAVSAAPVATILLLGTLFPWANVKGAIVGAVTSILTLLWLCAGASLNKVNFANSEVYPIDTCPVNATLVEVTENINVDDVFFIYKLSFLLFMPFGLIVGFVSGAIASLVTGPQDPSKLDPRMICVPLRRFLPVNDTELNKDENYDEGCEMEFIKK